METKKKNVTCPFCQKENNCGVEQKSGCWCQSITVPEAMLALLPVKLKNISCVCVRCIDLYNENPSAFELRGKVIEL